MKQWQPPGKSAQCPLRRLAGEAPKIITNDGWPGGQEASGQSCRSHGTLAVSLGKGGWGVSSPLAAPCRRSPRRHPGGASGWPDHHLSRPELYAGGEKSRSHGTRAAGGSADGRWRRRGGEGPSSSPRRRGGGRAGGRDAICHGAVHRRRDGRVYERGAAVGARRSCRGAVDPAT